MGLGNEFCEERVEDAKLNAKLNKTQDSLPNDIIRNGPQGSLPNDAMHEKGPQDSLPNDATRKNLRICKWLREQKGNEHKPRIQETRI